MDHIPEPVRPSFFKGCILAFVMMLVAISISMAFCTQCQAQPAQLHILNIPIATTMPIDAARNWQTGVTCVNVSTSQETILISRVEYIDRDSDAKNVGWGFAKPIAPGRRWSQMVSDVIGMGKDGQINLYIVAGPRAQFKCFSSVFVDPMVISLIPAWEITSREIQ